MKKILICAIALFCLTTSTTAQTAKEVQKQRKEIYKMSKEELNQKATKDARKAAKEYKKEGWKAAPGALPLEKQLDRLSLSDEDGGGRGYVSKISDGRSHEHRRKL